jgi:soluble lytic murein transglycosylase-like protein
MFSATADRRRGGPQSSAARSQNAAGILLAGLLLAPAANASDDVADVDGGNTPSALIAQARAYEHGEGVPKEPLKAAALYCTAARDGDAEAQFSLGWMYANGRGVAHDDAVAASLFALAAAAGHAEAAKMLRFVGDASGALPDCMRPPEPPPRESVAESEADPFAVLPPWKQKIADQVAVLAPRYALEPRLALAIIAVESNFEPRARSSKDARGLMQLTPKTASRFNVGNPYDIKDNLRGGLAYLRWLLAYYQGQVALAVAAYNAGEAAVDRYRGIPPFPETRDYVQRVLRLFRSEWHAFDPRVVAPSSFLTIEGAEPR